MIMILGRKDEGRRCCYETSTLETKAPPPLMQGREDIHPLSHSTTAFIACVCSSLAAFLTNHFRPLNSSLPALYTTVWIERDLDLREELS